jgi:plastocyanin
MIKLGQISLVVGSVLLLLAAGCGGGDGSTEQSTQTQADTGAVSNATASGEALTGTVGPGFTITLTQGGEAVSSLPAGTYDVMIDDKASIHNFHLTGPGVDEATGVSETGTTTWTVTLEKGEYTFQCDPHASSMNGSFSVT